MEATEQGKKQRYDYIKGYTYVKGQSGNLKGRPIGSKSLKQFAKEYLAKLPPEEKLEFMKALPEDLVWRMAEGNPQTDVTSKGEAINPKPITDVRKDYRDNKDNGDVQEDKSDTRGDISQQDSKHSDLLNSLGAVGQVPNSS
jgi:hypothetical protein